MEDRHRSYIQANTRRFVEELRTLVAQPSISAQGIGMEECTELLLEMMSAAGISCRILATDGYPVVYGEVTSSSSSRTMLVYGHYDVQPPEPLDEWMWGPFDAHVEDGRLYGRGAADDKGQFFPQIKAVETLIQNTGECPINLKFMFEGEEEIGSPNLASFVEGNRSLLRADVFFRSDGNKHESGRPLIKLGQKGMLYVEFCVEEGVRDLHSSRSNVAKNPVWVLIEALRSLYDPVEWKVLIDGFYDRVSEITPTDREFIANIPFKPDKIEADMGTRIRSGLTDGTSYYEAFLLTPHLNICGVEAGYTGSGPKTILPRAASAKLDFRLGPRQNPDDIEQLLRKHLDSLGFNRVSLKTLTKTPPARTPSNHPYVGRVIDSLKAVYGCDPIVYPSSEGSGPAYVFTDLLSLPMVIVPCAQFDCRMHAPNENIELSGVMQGIELFIDLLYRESGVA